MFRKLILTSVTAAGLITPLAATPQADAADFRFEYRGGSRYYEPRYRHRDHDHHYHVYYRHCDGYRWRLHGTYGSHHRAHQVERWLEHQGYEARVAHH